MFLKSVKAPIEQPSECLSIGKACIFLSQIFVCIINHRTDICQKMVCQEGTGWMEKWTLSSTERERGHLTLCTLKCGWPVLWNDTVPCVSLSEMIRCRILYFMSFYSWNWLNWNDRNSPKHTWCMDLSLPPHLSRNSRWAFTNISSLLHWSLFLYDFLLDLRTNSFTRFSFNVMRSSSKSRPLLRLFRVLSQFCLSGILQRSYCVH